MIRIFLASCIRNLSSKFIKNHYLSCHFYEIQVPLSAKKRLLIYDKNRFFQFFLRFFKKGALFKRPSYEPQKSARKKIFLALQTVDKYRFE